LEISNFTKSIFLFFPFTYKYNNVYFGNLFPREAIYIGTNHIQEYYATTNQKWNENMIMSILANFNDIFNTTPIGVWNILEVLLTLIFFLMGFFFLVKFMNGRSSGLESTNRFNIGYAFFFWANAINQLIYIAESIPELFPRFNSYIYKGTYYLFVFEFEPIALKTQIILMVLLLLISIGPVMSSIELYLKNRKNQPLFKATMFGIVVLSLIFMIFFIYLRAIHPEGITGPDLLYTGQVETAGGIVTNILLIFVALYILVLMIILIWNFVIFYLILAIKSAPGAMRNKSLLIFFGIMALYGGLMVGNLLRPDLTGWTILMGPIAFLIGMILLVIGFNKKMS
jgi:hypothetical protein